MEDTDTGKKAFIVGPGFIGWNILDLLIQDGYEVTGLVRREEHAKGIQASGASAVIGDLDDKAFITKHSALHDVIIHTATADHLPSVEAVLEGIKMRAFKGQMTIFIHTSGTSVLDDKSDGQFKSDKIYTDRTRDDMDSVPDDAPHREVDLTIVKSQLELGEKAKMAIMCPPLIYGWTHDRGTIQIPTLTRFSLKHGYTPYVGKGLGVESNIHVLDLARAYIYVLRHLQNSTPEETLENPYFFCECTGSNEPSWYDYSAQIASSLSKAGKKVESEPKQLPSTDLYEDLFSKYTPAIVGMNSRSRAVRLRVLGWEPKEKDWKRSFEEDELPKILQESNEGVSGYGHRNSAKNR